MKGPFPMSSKSDRDYQAECDHRTMMDAAEVQSDKSRMAGVKKHHKKQTKKLSLVQRQMMQTRRR